jgi:hypothetical protein
MEGREIPSKSLRTFTLSPRRIRRSTPTADTGRRGDACHGPGTRKKSRGHVARLQGGLDPFCPLARRARIPSRSSRAANRDHTGEFPASAWLPLVIPNGPLAALGRRCEDIVRRR